MHLRGGAKLLGILGLGAALLSLIMVQPRPWLGARVAAWRFSDQIAIAEQFLLAAERRAVRESDAARLRAAQQGAKFS